MNKKEVDELLGQGTAQIIEENFGWGKVTIARIVKKLKDQDAEIEALCRRLRVIEGK